MAMSLELSHYPLPGELAADLKRIDDYVKTMEYAGKKVDSVTVFAGVHQRARAFLKKAAGVDQPNLRFTYKGIEVLEGAARGKKRGR